MNEEHSYIFYTFFKNLQEMKEKPPWCLFEIYHMYGNGPNYWNGPEWTHIIPIASWFFSYFDTIYIYRLIPDHMYNLYIFPKIVTPFLVYRIDTGICAYSAGNSAK